MCDKVQSRATFWKEAKKAGREWQKIGRPLSFPGPHFLAATEAAENSWAMQSYYYYIAA